MNLLFTYRRSIFSRMIKRFTWSDWSHVGLVYKDEIIESLMFKGVIRRPLQEALEEYDGTVLLPVQCTDPQRVWDVALSLVGKGYDYFAILGFFFRRDWQSGDRWHCAEAVTWAFQEAEQPLLNTTAAKVNRIQPQHLIMSLKVG